MSNSPDTRVTLLLRLRDKSDQCAWDEFHELYASHLYAWARSTGLKGNDAADVTQTVLEKLVSALREFRYNPDQGRFRDWLRQITVNAAHDAWRALQRQPVPVDEKILFGEIDKQVQDAPIISLLETVLREELLAEAERRVAKRTAPKTWQVYLLAFKQDMSLAEVAEKLQLPVTNVAVYKGRMLENVRAEVEKLEEFGFEE